MVSGNLLHDIFVNLVLEEVIYSMVWSGPKAARSASSQAEAIRLIADHQPLTMTQLGTMLIRESGTNPSRLVGRLVASGQIERKINAADRCAVSLRLTSQGSGAAVQIAKIEEGMYAIIDKMLSDTESERLIRPLRALVVNQSSSEAIEHRVKFKSSNFNC